MTSPFLSVSKIIALLATAPQQLAALAAEVDEDRLQTPPAPDAWSAHEILAHLRASADVWGRCITDIATVDHPTLRAISPRTWIKRTDYLAQPFHPALHAFTAQRAALVAFLEPLPLASWSRAATVRRNARSRTRTLHDYAHGLVTHEQRHLEQIARIVQPSQA